MKNDFNLKVIPNSVPSIFKTLKKSRNMTVNDPEIEVLLVIQSNERPALPDMEAFCQPRGKRPTYSFDEFSKKYSIPDDVFSTLTNFFKAAKEKDPRLNFSMGNDSSSLGMLNLSMDAYTCREFFGVELGYYVFEDRFIRGHDFDLSIPEDIAEHVTTVMGLHGLPFQHASILAPATSDKKPPPTPTPIKPGIVHIDSKSSLFGQPGAYGLAANYWSEFYDFPESLTGDTQFIGIICLGGGYTEGSMKSYFEFSRLPHPLIKSYSSGSQNNPGGNLQFDGEVSTDIQTAGAVAPDAIIGAFFARNSACGLYRGVAEALHKGANIISISYCLLEDSSMLSERDARCLNELFLAAACLNTTICAASGDWGSTGGDTSEELGVYFPASSPYVLGVGGTCTFLDKDLSGIKKEVVWNEPWTFMGETTPLATSGGFSKFFEQPAYQKSVIPDEYPQNKCAVPDVSAMADPSKYGLYIRISHFNYVAGGTSAACPLWAGLICRFNERLGPLGFVNPDLYGIYEENPEIFKDIYGGNNSINSDVKQWASRKKSWDPCTGMGSPRGEALLAAFEALIKEGGS